MKLIGFSGNMGVGKSTAIERLKDDLHRKTKLVKFAQPLYDMQEMIYRRVEQVHKRPSFFTKDRKLLQWLGTDWGRDTIRQSIWVDLWKAEVTDHNKGFPFDIIVCDDVRFDNEAETVKSLGGIIVKITSQKADSRIDTKAGIQNHKSEGGIDQKYIDYLIKNDGTMEDFRASLDEMYARYL